MSIWRRLGIRVRLALALSGVALLSIAFATVLSNSGVTTRLDQSASTRLHMAANHTAQLASELYQSQHQWTPQTLAELGHLGGVSDYRLAVYDTNGKLLGGLVPLSKTLARQAVIVSDASVGSIVLSPSRGQILTGTDNALRDGLNTDHMVAAVAALLVGLFAALLIAEQFSRPLRKLTEAASMIEKGELGARVPLTGAPETAALGRAFNRLAETLTREEEVRRAAAADVAHELRTPLAGIISRVEAAQDGVLPDAEKNLEAIHGEALRLAALVNDLGKLAEAEQPGLTLKKEVVDFQALLTERLSLNREAFEAKQLTLSQDSSSAQVYGDPQRLTQIIDNLLSNALYYTAAGGCITVELSQRDDKATLTVTDTGVGIAAEDLPHIFDRFWRSDQSRSRHTGGAGIGLAIVHALVIAHNGQVSVQSQPGKGSSFIVTLPTRS